MNKRTKVVISGIGIVSPIGNNINSAWSNLINAKSGIKKIENFAVPVAAVTDDLHLDCKVPPIRSVQFAIAATKDALLDAALFPISKLATRIVM